MIEEHANLLSYASTSRYTSKSLKISNTTRY